MILAWTVAGTFSSAHRSPTYLLLTSNRRDAASRGDRTTLNRAPAVKPARARRGPSAYLVVISGPNFGEMYKLKGERSLLGRGERTDIRVLDDGVSREHAAIERDGGKMVLVDLGSTNGTFCNGGRVTRHDLTDGDKISIGATTILNSPTRIRSTSATRSSCSSRRCATG